MSRPEWRTASSEDEKRRQSPSSARIAVALTGPTPYKPAINARQPAWRRANAVVRQRTRAKNQVHATLVRNLKGKPPVSDLFGVRGRRWLAAQDLPADEQETVAACLRQIAFLDGEIAPVERALAEQVLASAEMRRLLTLPGVNFVTACALLAAIGDIRRFASARQLVSYLGLDPRLSHSGAEPARHGRISK